jgi:hypothetical protein
MDLLSRTIKWYRIIQLFDVYVEYLQESLPIFSLTNIVEVRKDSEV